MSTDWYFVRDGARVGPCPREDVQALLASGELPPATLVWTAGMENWRPASETPELAPLPDGTAAAPRAWEPGASPDPAPYATEPRPAPYGQPAYSQPAHDEPAYVMGEARATPYPWRRWAARLLDMFWFGLFLGTVFAFVGPETIAQANPIAMNVLVLALYVPVEALVLSAFGATPGKRLLRIRVTNADGSRLEFGTAMERSVQVWLRGLGLGLPLVSLFTMVTSYVRLTGDGRTAWDEKLGLRVTHGEMSTPRWAGVVILMVLVFAMIVVAGMPAEV